MGILIHDAILYYHQVLSRGNPPLPEQNLTTRTSLLERVQQSVVVFPGMSELHVLTTNEARVTTFQLVTRLQSQQMQFERGEMELFIKDVGTWWSSNLFRKAYQFPPYHQKLLFQFLGLESKIRKELGDANEILDRILLEENVGSYDFAFIDADKLGYTSYFEKLMKLVKSGGLIITDNILLEGKVVDPNVNDEITVALRKFLGQGYKDDRIDLSVVPVGDGFAICRKK